MNSLNVVVVVAVDCNRTCCTYTRRNSVHFDVVLLSLRSVSPALFVVGENYIQCSFCYLMLPVIVTKHSSSLFERFEGGLIFQCIMHICTRPVLIVIYIARTYVDSACFMYDVVWWWYGASAATAAKLDACGTRQRRSRVRVHIMHSGVRSFRCAANMFA